MPLNVQPLAIQFQGGLHTKIDRKQVPVTKLANLENATFIKGTTLAKRNGYRAYSRLIDNGSSEYGNPVGMSGRGNELLIHTDDRAYSYRSSADRWVDTGEVASTTLSERPIGRTGTHQTVPDHATKSGVTVVAWEDSRGGVYCSVVESATGRILLAETQLDSAGISPRCVPCGTVLHVYWARAAAGRLFVAVINPASPTVAPSPQTLIEDLSTTNPVYDATDNGSLFTSINPALMTWALNGGGYRVGWVHPSGVMGSPVTGLPSSAAWADTITGPIAIATNRLGNSQIAVVYCNTTPNVRWLDPTALLTSAGTYQLSATNGTWNRATLEVTALVGGLSTMWWAAELSNSELNLIECGKIDTAGTVLASPTARVLRGHSLCSRAFLDNGNVYATVAHGAAYFPYAAVVRISGDSFGGTLGKTTMCYARVSLGQYHSNAARKHLASAHPVDPDSSGLSREHAVCVGYRILLDSDGDTQAFSTNFGETGIKLATFDFDADRAYQSTQLGRGSYLAGACPQHYDGQRWAEAGFHCAPDFVEGHATPVAEGAAGAMAAGTYNYKFAYEDIDGQGELHLGAVSIPYTVTIAGSKKVNVTLPTLRLTSKKHVRIAVFRSPVNQTGEPELIPYYRVTSLSPSATGDNGYIANDASVDTVSFVDNLTDTQLLTKEPLYTNGGIPGNDMAPIAGDVIAGGKNRLFATDPTDPQVVRYSQEIVDETGIEWPIALTVRVDPYGGRIVAIGVMDGIVYVFCETAIYRFGGPGPDRAPGASSNSFSPPELVTSDVGCKSPNSICQGPVGIFFQSEKGIKLLDRTGQVQDVGADVYAFNAQTITRATLLPDRHQVVFLTADEDGYTLLYDYERRQWSKFTNHLGYDARVINGTYVYLRTDGRVFAETPGEYRDDNSHITMRIETAPIHFLPHFQGWQRILWAYFLGEHKSDHTLMIRYRIDDNAGYSSPVPLDVNTNIDPRYYGEGVYGSGTYGNGTSDTTRYQRGIHYNVPCQAIQFRIEDVEETADFGASFELSELLIIGGVLDTRPKLGAARTN